MARPRLADAAKSRVTNKSSKSNAKQSKSKDSTSSTGLAKPNNQDSSITRKDLTVGGLPTLSTDQIQSQLPQIKVDAYNISDPHKLPPTLPQVTDAQLEENKRLAKGAMNAQESEILALQITSGKFKIIGQQAKTVGEGVKAVTEIEKTTGLMIDLRNQQEITSQKSNQLDFNIYKTDKEISISAFDKLSLDEKERLAKTKSESAKADATSAETELSEKLKKLGIG